MRRAVPLAAALALVVFAWPAPAGDDAKKDLEALQGVWKIVEMKGGGMDLPAFIFQDMKFGFDKTKAYVKLKDKTIKEGEAKLDSTKSPKQLTITGKDKDGKDKADTMIFKFDKDKLYICGSDEGSPPKEFASPKDSKITLMVLEKEKK